VVLHSLVNLGGVSREGRHPSHIFCPTVAVIVLVLCSIIPRAAAGQIPDDEIALHFRAGQEAMRQGQFVQAAEEFKKVLSLDPTLLEAEVNLGLAYHSAFEYELAARHLAKALQRRPNLIGPSIIAGTDYLKLGSLQKALPYFQRVLKLDPSNQEALLALASVYLVQENFRGASEEFRQLAGFNPDKAEAWFKLGHQYLDLSARVAYRGARLYPDSAWGHRFLGDLLFQRNRWDEAAQEYKKALAIDSRQEGLHTSLGNAYLHAGNLQDAEAEFRLALQNDSSSEPAWVGIAEAALSRNDAAASLAAITRAWEISPEHLALQREFPSVVLSRETALDLVDKLSQSPDGPAKHFLQAALYTIIGDSSSTDAQWKAFQSDFLSWRKSKSRQTSNPKPCNTHNYEACENFLKSEKRLLPTQQLLLGKIQFALHQYEHAAETLGKVPSTTKQGSEASYWLALSYHQLGAECYEHLQESFPDSWRTHQLRAEGYALRKELDGAIKELQAAVQLRPESPELHEALGEVYVDNHSDDEARSELEKSLELDPSRSHALYLLGRLFVQKRENDKAVLYLQKAIRIQPDLNEASSLLGTAYVRLGQFANAVPKLEKAAPFDHYGNVHYQLYLAYRKLGQTERAQKAMARSQELRRSSLEHDQAMIMGTPQVDSEP
jgi:tetratricopeptide (TPR) repeat protein